jgi:rhomboid protease GluP
VEILKTEKENWLTRKGKTDALLPTFLILFLITLGSTIYLTHSLQSEHWMTATPLAVFENHEYWKLWTTLFAHADLTHLLSNLLLFIPFAYFLIGHFGLFYFPVVGFFIGGMVNLWVLKNLPAETHLLGASGVVYWLGASYMTLVFLIDHRQALHKRLLKLIGVSLILFFPETFKPEVSYFSHFLGFIFGIGTALILYFLRKKIFDQAKKYDYIVEYPEEEF